MSNAPQSDKKGGLSLDAGLEMVCTDSTGHLFPCFSVESNNPAGGKIVMGTYNFADTSLAAHEAALKQMFAGLEPFLPAVVMGMRRIVKTDPKDKKPHNDESNFTAFFVGPRRLVSARHVICTTEERSVYFYLPPGVDKKNGSARYLKEMKVEYSSENRDICFFSIAEDERLDRFFTYAHKPNPLPKDTVVYSVQFNGEITKVLYKANTTDAASKELPKPDDLNRYLHAEEKSLSVGLTEADRSEYGRTGVMTYLGADSSGSSGAPMFVLDDPIGHFSFVSCKNDIPPKTPLKFIFGIAMHGVANIGHNLSQDLIARINVAPAEHVEEVGKISPF